MVYTGRTELLHPNLSVNEKGRLCIAGSDTVELARKHGTPLIVMDEDRIRENCRIYKNAMREYFGEGSYPLYASKAFSCKYIYRLAREEGIGIDLVSSGELYTAAAAGFDLKKAFFHGNNKTDFDISYALDCGVGYFVVDNLAELDRIDELASAKGVKQKVLLRLTPGIDPHTHKAVVTGNIDSKFGLAITTGQADHAVEYALTKRSVELCGFHCHIGSQIFDAKPFCDAAVIMIGYLASVKEKYGYEAKILNLGGGFGVKYTPAQPQLDYAELISVIADCARKEAERNGIDLPVILMEPGRSIVADSALTLYTVGGVKEIPGYKSYISVDGGMSDNPRYALYQSEYTLYHASDMNRESDGVFTVAGRCCESGDILQENVSLPKPKRDDILAVTVTGAYNYSMSSNYNRIARPAVIAIRNGEDIPVIKRESLEDIVKNDI